MLDDSGNRRKFESGAVRDIAEGKGRCDLLPLDVIAKLFNTKTIGSLAAFQETNNITKLYEAVKHFADELEISLPSVALEVSKHYEVGAIKYTERNWQLGIPTHSFIDSATRHWLKWRRGDTDEAHDRAFVWNIISCIWTIQNRPELNDAAPEILKK